MCEGTQAAGKWHCEVCLGGHFDDGGGLMRCGLDEDFFDVVFSRRLVRRGEDAADFKGMN